jgi:hypothetical protein
MPPVVLGNATGLARFVSRVEQEPREADQEARVTMNMSGSSVKRTIIAISAALTMSAVTVGAAVSPSQAGIIQIPGVARG